MRTPLFFFLLMMVAWHAQVVQAHEFTPGSVLFGDARDGAWEFPAVEVLVSPAQQQTEDADSVNFQFGMPGSVETMGQAEWQATEGGLVRLNDLQEPEFLVGNQLTWRPGVFEPREAWLRFEYRVWSRETERGFDVPVLVVYEGSRLVYQESIESPCEIEVCPWRTRRVYLGQVATPLVFHFLAGEMGDTEKPSGVDLRGMKLEVNSEQPQGLSVTSPTEPTPSLIAQVQEIAHPSLAARPRAVPTTSVKGNQQGAAVLGAQDAGQERPAEPVSLLEKIVFHPAFLWLLWTVSFVVIVVVWRRFEKRTSSTKHFLKKGDK